MRDAFLDDETLRYEEEGIFARDFDGQLIRLDQATADDFSKLVTLTIDGRQVTVPKAVPSTDSQGNILRDDDGEAIPRPTTIFDAAQKLFVKEPGDQNPIPILCHQEHLRPVAACRVCVVELNQMKRGQMRRERKLLPACQHRVTDGMIVHTVDSPDEGARNRVRSAVGTLVELLSADHLRPGDEGEAYNELAHLKQRFEIGRPRFTPRAVDRGQDDSLNLIMVDHNACILCDRCIRGCDEVKHNEVLGRAGKGYTAHIAFDLNDRMAESSCVRCGECMISCPTGALTFRGTPVDVHYTRSSVDDVGRLPVSIEELKQIPLFSGIPYKFLQWNANSVVKRVLEPGDVLCREGEYGSTAFVLLKGAFGVSIKASLAGVTNQRGKGFWGFVGRAVSRLTKSVQSAPKFIRNDTNAFLEYDPETGEIQRIMGPEDLILGEQACLNNNPRSATVTALTNAEVLEIRRNVLYMLQRNKSSRDVLNRVYRERVLGSHLQSVPFFASLAPQEREHCIDYLRDQIELVRLEPGQLVFRQGEPADHFYLVRLGFVKISQKHYGQERVLSYLGPGSHFGEIGLLSARRVSIADFIPEEMETGVRTATCTALDHVELVRIRGEDFQTLLDRFPVLRERFSEESKDILRRDAEARQSLEQPLSGFLENGLYMAKSLLVLDLERCTRCDECTKACADVHSDGVSRLLREGLRFDRFLVATSCRSCMDPYCMVGCPVDSIHRNRDTMNIKIEDWCIGCGLCANNCPYGNIQMIDREDQSQHAVRKATTCDLCSDVVGPKEDPGCVYACPHEAAFRMTGQDLEQLVLKAREG